ncbi:LuxE/PaaK family acyltransferase [Shewanella putrefaciens]|uniref:LuxE/PaaK family acyltransferase n=1 Tax=Shewanella putrefaciens TaxID=24 RepID=UPI00286442B3|nr:acyl-protein synthetase [Shewanella putrefaciens]MDR6962968.1 phenylacetate-coenzyme A ligase PaaK-like adenylate-forming protein [Shewanella putrefaciens]
MNWLWEHPIFALPQVEKEALLLAELNKLTSHHEVNCPSFANILKAFHWGHSEDYSQLPYLACRLFKLMKLQSIPDAKIFKMISSSGTTGAASQIVLDRETASLQTKVLVKILQEFIGKQRLPMLLIEKTSLVQNRNDFSARGAGAVGLSFLGRDHTYALDSNMQPDWKTIDAFCEQYSNQPTILFGFTFMVWEHFLEQIKKRGHKLSFEQGILFHSGGWKKLQHKAVDNVTFKMQCSEWLGITKVHNFYGMAEQIGSIFVECESGHLHAPLHSDVIIREPTTLAPLPIGKEGLIQVLSAIPKSYPGHSLLTEDIGRIIGIDNCCCGRKGQYFEVIGRQKGAEVRGCSDTFQ